MVYDFIASTTKLTQSTLWCYLRERNEHEMAGIFCARARTETKINL